MAQLEGLLSWTRVQTRSNDLEEVQANSSHEDSFNIILTWFTTRVTSMSNLAKKYFAISRRDYKE